LRLGLLPGLHRHHAEQDVKRRLRLRSASSAPGQGCLELSFGLREAPRRITPLEPFWRGPGGRDVVPSRTRARGHEQHKESRHCERERAPACPHVPYTIRARTEGAFPRLTRSLRLRGAQLQPHPPPPPLSPPVAPSDTLWT